MPPPKQAGRSPAKGPTGRLRGVNCPDVFSISNAIERIVGAKHSGVDIEELGAEVMIQVGGATGMVKMITKSLKDAVRGSAEHIRLMDLMVRIVQLAADKSVNLKDLDQMTDEDLEAYALNLMVKVGVPGIKEQGWITHVCI
jgi:hypothetical protein